MSDLQELEALVRAVRPEPAPAFAARLDTRAAAGFPRPPRAWRWPLELLRANLLPAGAVAGVVIAVVAAAALNGGGSSSSSDSGASATSATSSGPARAASPSVSAAVPATPATGADSVAPPSSPRLVERDAEITLSTHPADVEDVADNAMSVADSLGGYVETSSVVGGSGAGATITLEIPASRLPDALAKLSQLAHVTRRVQTSQDLTNQRAVLEARVRDARAERDGLRNRLAHADTDKQADHLRALLARAERRVTDRERSVAALTRRGSFASVDVTVNGDERTRHPVAAAGGWSPRGGLHDALRVLEVSASVVLVALAVAVPVGVVVALGWLAAHVLVRRRRERALELA